MRMVQPIYTRCCVAWENELEFVRPPFRSSLCLSTPPTGVHLSVKLLKGKVRFARSGGGNNRSNGEEQATPVNYSWLLSELALGSTIHSGAGTFE